MVTQHVSWKISEGLACADPGARTSIGVSGIYNFRIPPKFPDKCCAMTHPGLMGMVTDPLTRVVLVNKKLQMILQHQNLRDLQEAIVEKLNLNVNKFYPDAGGIMMGYKDIKIKKGEVTASTTPHPVNIEASFYLFQPVVGSDLLCVVSRQEEGQVTCLAHGVFPVDVVTPPKYEDRLFIGQIVRVRVEVVAQSAWQHPRILAVLLDRGDSMITVVEDEDFEPKPRILMSGLDSTSCTELTAIVTMLGGVVTDRPRFSTHLVMNKLGRTTNIMLCLPTVKYVISTTWVLDSGKAGGWLEEEKYVLHDAEVEQHYKFSLSNTLAKTKRDELFKGIVFFVTPSVQPSLKTLSKIIIHSGGMCARYCEELSGQYFNSNILSDLQTGGGLWMR